MPEAFERFERSMQIGFEQWHDGIGYDLQALALLRGKERQEAERLLIAHLADPGDWRDVEALAALDSPAARTAIEAARHHRNARVRNRAITTLLRDPRELEAELEDLVVKAVEQGHYEMAERLPTPRVQSALLELARKGHEDVRCHAAALLLYLRGKTSEPFEWSERPFFLRFNTRDAEALQAAWEELRQWAEM